MILSAYLLLIGCISIDGEHMESNPELSHIDYSELKSDLFLKPYCELAFQKYAIMEQSVILRSKVIKVIKKCPSSQTSQNYSEIVHKCENYYSYDFILDPSLFTPITSITKNVTYWNKYCGICNLENELSAFESWSPWLSCFKNSTFDSEQHPTERFYNVTMLAGRESEASDDDFRLITDPKRDVEYKCRIWPVLSNRLEPHVPDCGNKFSNSENDIPILQATPMYETVRAVKTQTNIHVSAGSEQSSKSSMESYCDYKNEYGEECSINRFLNEIDDDSICNENGYFVTNSSKFENVWNRCSTHTSKPSTIYVCGPTEGKFYKKFKTNIVQGMDYVSMFLLIVYLAISANKQNLRKLPQRIFYSYSLTLLAVYVNEYTFPFVELCLVRYYVFFYIWQSHSFWILITSYDLWRIVYSSLKMKKIKVEGQTSRYLVYCLICWGLPSIFLATLFPTLNNDQKSRSCPVVSGFDNEILCSSTPNLNEYSYYLEWITIVIFLVIVPCLLVLTCLFIFLKMRKQVRSNVNRSYVLAMLKVAIMMGVHWILLVYVVVFNSSEKLSIITEFISALHGSFVFFAFGIEKNTWNGVKEFLCKRFISELQSKSSSQQTQEMSASIDLPRINESNSEKF